MSSLLQLTKFILLSEYSQPKGCHISLGLWVRISKVFLLIPENFKMEFPTFGELQPNLVKIFSSYTYVTPFLAVVISIWYLI